MATKRTQRMATLGIVAVVGGGLIASSHHRYDYNQVCADAEKNVRVDDAQCDDNGTGTSGGFTGSRYRWYSIPTDREERVGGVGERVSGGSYVAPPSDATVARGVVSSSGGKVSRGGFGHTSASSSSVGG